MSKSLWSGNRPKTDQEARQRLCEAALACLEKHGFEKTTMSNIAREAGAARPTLYKFFKNKNLILEAAIDDAALSFTKSVVQHAEQFRSVEDRIIETIIYVVTELPKHRYLSLIFTDESAAELRERAFSAEATLIFAEMTAEPIVELRPSLKAQGAEITEIMSRFAISMILFPGKYKSRPDDLRQLIQTRILPGLIPG